MKPKVRDIFDATAPLSISSTGTAQITLAGNAESSHMITPRVHRRAAKEKMIAATKRQTLREVMPALPEPGSVYHIVSNGRFDYWTWVPVMLGYMGHATEFYGSTWTLNRANAVELIGLIDAGRHRS